MSSPSAHSQDQYLSDSEQPITTPSAVDTIRMSSQSTTTASTPSQVQYANVTKLTSTTFHNWKLRLETLLGAYKLWRFILEEIPTPTDPTLLESHQTSDFQALSAIHSTIDDKRFQIVSSCATAYKAYQAICRHHGYSGGISTATLFFELVNLWVTQDITIKDHIHRFWTLHTKLKSNIRTNPELKISDHFIAILLLFSLPSDYAPLVQTTLPTMAFDKIDINHPRLQQSRKPGYHFQHHQHGNDCVRFEGQTPYSNRAIRQILHEEQLWWSTKMLKRAHWSYGWSMLDPDRWSQRQANFRFGIEAWQDGAIQVRVGQGGNHITWIRRILHYV